MDAIKKKLRSVALLALVSVTVTGLPIAPPLTHYSQQPVQTEQFHAPQHHEHRHQRNQEDRFEHSSMNLPDICAHHSDDSRHLELCHPKFGPRNYPRPYQPDPHMNNAFPKQAQQIRIRRGPEQQGNSFPKDSYFINRDQNVAQEQRIPMNRNHAGTRGPTSRHSINRTPFEESIHVPIPPQDLNQPPCPGPGCPPYQSAQQRSPQHIHAPIVVDPPTIATNSHYPWQQSHGPAQRSDPILPSQNPYMPNDSLSVKPNYNDDIRKLMAIRGNPTNPKASYVSKQLKDSKPCSLSSSSSGHGKSCRILIVYDFSDADVTYETRLETFEG